MIEHPFLYQSEFTRLPHYLRNTSDGLTVTDSIIEGEPGPYELVFDFGHSRDHLRDRVPVAERVTANTRNVRFLGLKIPFLAQAMHNITRINRDSKPEDVKARLEYQRNLFRVFKAIGNEVKKELKKTRGKTVFFPPKNGGDLIRAFFQESGIINDPRTVVDYELKRVLTKDRLMVGYRQSYFPDLSGVETAVICDDCLATDVSVSATINLVRQINPGIRKFLVAVSAATQRGVEALLDEFPDIDLQIIAATPVFLLDEQNYLRRTAEEGYPNNEYAVGDMGAWSKKFPSIFNLFARWNRHR